MKNILIPNIVDGSTINIGIEKNMVIVGANGSGKSRLGSKIDQLNDPSKRISAQRYLQIEEVVPRLDFDSADVQLKGSYKHQSPITPQNDFKQALVSLFAQESRRDSEYVKNSRSSETKISIPQSVKEEVVDIWNFIFPHRPLKLEKDRVRAISESNEFSATEMSDGEKVGLYLITQTLLAEKDCILIIDEPELHLHKALMVRLWNKLEEYRHDCTFIYITHDLDFAVSKPASKLVWIQSYKNGLWSWKELDNNEVIPENLYLELLGSKKPILFVEGEKGSLDFQIYQIYYENFTVIPRGSCETVIESVKGLKNNEDLHDKKVYGLIDKDFRPDTQITALEEEEIYCLSLNEVENLFLLPGILHIVCEHLSKLNKKEEIFTQIRDIYEANKDQVIFSSSKYRIYRNFSEKFNAIKTREEYDIFKQNIFSEMDQQFTSVILPDKDADIVEILKVYPHKGLANQVQVKIELSKNGYKNLVLSLFTSNKRREMIEIFKPYLPQIT